MLIVAIALLASSTVTVAWPVSALFLFVSGFLGKRFPLFAVVRWIYVELRPLYLPCVIIVITNNVVTGRMLEPDIWAGDLFALLNWFALKDIDVDDDRWKRRKARVLEKIKRLGSRLVVVPAGGKS